MKKISERQQKIIDFLMQQNALSISDIHTLLEGRVSIPTLNRDIADLVQNNVLEKKGAGRATQYILSAFGKIIVPIDSDIYFSKNVEERIVQKTFDFDVFSYLGKIEFFSEEELVYLQQLQKQYQEKRQTISPALERKELKRLTIELSWKSAQIEGNTYSLLETEALFNQSEEAKGHSKYEAIMLLNHKMALEYIYQNSTDFVELSLKKTEEIHYLLTRDLGVAKGLRSRLVRITGTQYEPLGNQHQIEDAIAETCRLVNSQKNVFCKAFLAVLLLSYIQPFEDGNKRTSRIIANALLLSGNICPLSYRNVSELEYKKAILLFYERNNISAFKKIFIEQCEFATENYF